jgi:hypothetical protein
MQLQPSQIIPMKRTELKRKTPLKSSGFKKPTDGKWSSFKPPKPGQFSSFNTPKSGNCSTFKQERPGTPSNSVDQKSSYDRTRAPIKHARKETQSRSSLKGAGRTKSDIEYHSNIIELGCIACIVSNQVTVHPLQIHHTSGRSKGRRNDLCEKMAICLCAEHHDKRIYSGFSNGIEWITVRADEPSVHHDRSAFTAKFGSQIYLLHETYALLSSTPPWLTVDEWREYLELISHKRQEYLTRILALYTMKERRAFA